MDLISAYRDGLAAQLADEARGLSGRPTDHVQRAIVAHHLFDHSGGRHVYALLTAEGALALEPAIAAMAKAASRSRWRLGRAKTAALLERIDTFRASLDAIDRDRCEAMWIAYRAAQHDGTLRLIPETLGALRDGDARGLFLAHQAWFEAHWGLAVEEALGALDWPLSPKPVAVALSALRITADRFDRAERRGLKKAERSLLADKRFPAKFAANPAHHYYALQRAMAARRRDERDLLLGIPLDEAVRLAVAA